MSRGKLFPVNFGPQTKSLWPARSLALSPASPARGEPAPSAAVIARGIFGIVGVRLASLFVRSRPVGRSVWDCEWGIIYNGFSKPNYPTRRAGRGGRLAARFLPLFPLCICNDPRLCASAAGSGRAAKGCVPTHSWRNYNRNRVGRSKGLHTRAPDCSWFVPIDYPCERMQGLFLNQNLVLAETRVNSYTNSYSNPSDVTVRSRARVWPDPAPPLSLPGSSSRPDLHKSGLPLPWLVCVAAAAATMNSGGLK